MSFRIEDYTPSCDGPAFQAYQAAAGLFWIPAKIGNFNTDRASYEAMSEPKRRLFRTNLAFFLFADKMVVDNIRERLIQQLKAEYFLPELDMDGVFQFMNFQVMMEDIHGITYKSGFEGTIPPAERRNINFAEMPGVMRKLESMRYYGGPDVPLNERLFAWFLVEGLFFQETFGAIFYFSEAEFPATWQSNKLISRDENLHTMFGAMLVLHLREPLSQEAAHRIARNFMDTSKVFCEDALPQPIFGLNSEKLTQYAQFRCDLLLKMVNYEPIYNVTNPLKYMEETGLDEAFNFFEIRPTYDHGANVLTSSPGADSQQGSGDDKVFQASQDNFFVEID